MQNNFLDLDYIINVNNFQKIQDSLAEATEMALLTVDYKGVPVTKHSRCSDFCKTIRANPEYCKLCNKCDSRGGLEATRLQQPYIYICHMGLLDFAIPIIVDGQYIGAIMAGQVLLSDENETETLECIVNHKHKNFDLIKDELDELYKKLPVMSLDRVNAVANMIFQISNYIVEEALLKINLNEMNQRILSLGSIKEMNNSSDKNSLAETYKYYELETSNTRNFDMPNTAGIDKNNEGSLLYKNNIILKPALDYIQNNYCESIGLDDMASLCNVSTSYFSKLFRKALDDNFANYINKVRIKKAKEFLENSDTPIINIALDIGFEDCGYFIKVFKKLEGVTPAVYRNEYKNKLC